MSGYICVTFDFDALSAWVARGQLTASPRSRGEFAAVAVPRLLRLLDTRGLPATWFVPGHTVHTYPGLCREIVAAGHEIALHGYAHENVAELSEQQERDILRRSYDAVVEVTGTEPAGYRAPSWDLSEASVRLLLELGLRYDSSLMGDDYAPYFCRVGDVVDADGVRWGQPSELVEVPVSWSLDDFPHLEFLRTSGGVLPGLRDPAEMFSNWTMDLTYMLREVSDGVLTVTFHPEVIGRGHRLLRLEEWLDRIAGADVTFAMVDWVAREVAGGRQLGRFPDSRAGS